MAHLSSNVINPEVAKLLQAFLDQFDKNMQEAWYCGGLSDEDKKHPVAVAKAALLLTAENLVQKTGPIGEIYSNMKYFV
ncbi:MAG: hypothetical protein KQI81_08730 [Deltaproteobacteria bacterium]|nr:hypothetical protein [Deltaproteobacteria bacterium]